MSSIDLKAASRHLRYHAAAYALAAAMGILCIAPYAYFAMTPEYQGIALMGHDAEEHYLARIQETYDGHPSLGNALLPYKDTPYLSPGLGENAVAYLGMALGLSATQINLAAKLLFPAAIFLVIYGFALEGARSRAAALLSATAGMLGTALMSSPGEALALLRGNSSLMGVVWARPINPEVSGILLFAGLWLLYRLYTGRTASMLAIAATGIITGLSLYISPYVWSFLGACILLLCGHALWRRNASAALRYFLAGVFALALALPFALNYLAAHAHPGYAQAALEQGVLHNRTPMLGVWAVMLLCVPLFGRRLFTPQTRLFFIACAASLLSVLNQQVLTGLYLQPGHYHWYITKPLIGIVSGLAAWKLGYYFMPTRVRYAIAACAVAALFIGGMAAQMNFYHRFAPEARAAQEYAPLLDYLRALPQTAIIADPILSIYIPIYTQQDAPNNAYAKLYFRPTGYAEAADMAALQPTPALMQTLGAGLVISDTRADAWSMPAQEFSLKRAIGRFEIYAPR